MVRLWGLLLKLVDWQAGTESWAGSRTLTRAQCWNKLTKTLKQTQDIADLQVAAASRLTQFASETSRWRRLLASQHDPDGMVKSSHNRSPSTWPIQILKIPVPDSRACATSDISTFTRPQTHSKKSSDSAERLTMIKNLPQIKWCKSILNKWEKRCTIPKQQRRTSWQQNRSFWSKLPT